MNGLLVLKFLYRDKTLSFSSFFFFEFIHPSIHLTLSFIHHKGKHSSSLDLFNQSVSHRDVYAGSLLILDMSLSELVHSLYDYELALLLSLTANEHCIITSSRDSLPKVSQDISGSAILFGLQNSTATIQCSAKTTVKEFIQCCLQPATDGKRNLFSIIICSNLDRAPKDVQTIVLELIRTRQLKTKHATFDAPPEFLVVAMIERIEGKCALIPHLVQFFMMSHNHREDDDDIEDEDDDSQSQSRPSISSTSSASSISPIDRQLHRQTLFSPTMIKDVTRTSEKVYINADVRRYMSDLTVYLRMHRAIAGGSVSAAAFSQFLKLIKCLSTIHGQDYATPEMVKLAFTKVYNHRISVCSPKEERSLLWGSDAQLVVKLLEQLTPDLILESVLEEVRAPL